MPSGPRRRATASAASSAVAKQPRYVSRPPCRRFALNGLVGLLTRLTCLKPVLLSSRSSTSPSAAAAACACAAVIGRSVAAPGAGAGGAGAGAGAAAPLGPRARATASAAPSAVAK